jgi:hypothetical protein
LRLFAIAAITIGWRMSGLEVAEYREIREVRVAASASAR